MGRLGCTVSGLDKRSGVTHFVVRRQSCEIVKLKDIIVVEVVPGWLCSWKLISILHVGFWSCRMNILAHLCE